MDYAIREDGSFHTPIGMSDRVNATARHRRRRSSCSCSRNCLLLLLLLGTRFGCGNAWTAPCLRAHRVRQLNRLQSTLRHAKDENTDLLEDIQRKLDYQQKQIDQLLDVLISQQQSTDSTDTTATHKLLVKSASSSSTSPPQPLQMAPVKAMLFIDGTWLFYSIFQRESENCPICQRFGPIWPITHMVDWQALIRIVSRCLMEQYHSSGVQSPTPQLSSSAPSRAVEIVRASVFTSYKADTPITSHRYRMFEDLRQANFDVHMMETVGKSEKCVDIQLAVEMLHFATVPHAYDVAVLLTGDKDFMPAMIRTRQKGRQVALVSMKRGCNQALIKTDMLKDFDAIWLEDYIEELIIPKSAEDLPHTEGLLSVYTVLKVLRDFIAHFDDKPVSSRDVGRFLKTVRIGQATLLEELKNCYGGIYVFLAVQGSKMFSISFREEDYRDTTGRTYWIGLKPNADAHLGETAKRSNLSPAETVFFEDYSFATLMETMIENNALGMRQRDDLDSEHDKHETARRNEQSANDYAEYTLSQLKDMCRKRGLPVSGLKSAVIERLQDARHSERVEDTQVVAEQANAKRQRVSGPLSGNAMIASTISRHILALLKEYIRASGGQASSRDVGRYLAANGSSSKTGRQMSALQELKMSYGSLANFVHVHSDMLFRLEDAESENGDKNSPYTFFIGLHQDADAKI